MTGRPTTPRRALRKVLLRHSLLHPGNVITLVVITFICSLNQSSAGGAMIHFMMPIFFVFSSLFTSVQVLRKIGHLPISRSRLLPYIVLPPLAALAIGFFISTTWSIPTNEGSAKPRVGYRTSQMKSIREDRGFHATVQVPFEYWEFCWGAGPLDGDPRQSPQFASEQPALVHPLFWGSPLALINPYEVGREPTLGFASLQLSRAIEAVYGLHIEPGELEERYIQKLSNGSVYVKEETYTLLEDYPELLDITVDPERPTNYLLLVLGWFVVSLLTFSTNVPPATPAALKRRILLRVAGYGPLVAVFVASLILAFADRSVAQVLEEKILAALTGLLPASTALAWGCVLAIAALGYGCLQLRFERLEVPSGKIGNPFAERTFRNL